MSKDNFWLFQSQAKELEKKYGWSEAIGIYEKASDWLLIVQDFLQMADICQKIGYCFYRAALQAETNAEFKEKMIHSAEAYERMIEFLEKAGGEEGKINHAKAMVAWSRSCVESEFNKIADLLDEWWNLENKALKYYQKNGDLLAVGKICNNLMEGSLHHRIFLNAKEFVKRTLLGVKLGERAIKALLKTDDKYELAKAYTFSAWLYGIISFHYNIRTEDESFNLRYQLQKYSKKWLTYSEKAISFSEKIGDAWLIGWSHEVKGMGLDKGLELDKLLYHAKKVMTQGEIAKDNMLIAKGLLGSSLLTILFLGSEEDPEKRRYNLIKAMVSSKEALRRFQIINLYNSILMATRNYVSILTRLALSEVDSKKKQRMLKKAVQIGRKSFEIASKAFDQGQIWINFESAMVALSMALHRLSGSETEIEEKRALLRETLRILEKIVEIYEKVGQPTNVASAFGRIRVAMTQVHLAKISTSTKKKVEMLNKAIFSFEKGLEIFKRNLQLHPSRPLLQAIHYGGSLVGFGNILAYFYTITQERKHLFRALEAYKNAIIQFQMGGLSTRVAETYWEIAIWHDLLGEYSEAADNYENAAAEYGKATEKVSRLKNFYQDYSLYMQAWSHIERARLCHSAEEYDKAKDHYEEATKLHKASEQWSYLTPNYAAWSQLEEAEDLSRKENTVKAAQVFGQALKQFKKTEVALKTKIDAITEAEEKEMVAKLITNSELRRRYCQARISIEEAKILDRKGDYGLSSKNYGEAAKNIKIIIQQIESEAERKELHLIEFLCRAWEKMAIAEETTSSESYLEAASLFEQAKDLSRNRKTSLWALGNSSFCKGLAAGIKYQSTVDLAEHSRAKSLLKSAATSYFQAGFESASEYAKATQRLFDAYVFMNQAESEVDPERRAKQYHMAEKLLQISAGSFVKAKQPEKAAQAQQILRTVREEKDLAVSLNEVLHAPAVASTTMSFATPTPTGEASVGLERFEHANVQANLIAGSEKVRVRESFCLTLEFVNAGKEPALLTKVEDLVPKGFVVMEKPEIYRLEESCLNMKGKQLEPLRLVEAKVVLQASRKGVYQLRPTIYYLDELGQQKSLELKSLKLRVEEVTFSDRVTTGITEIDSLLFGGIPECYAVALTGPPSDSRNLLVKNFLEAGAERGQVTFYVAAEPVGLKALLGKPGFYLFMCNPKPKIEVPDLPNVYLLKSKIDLNNLNIALAKACHGLSKTREGSRRVCIEIVSEILLHYKADTTRKWLDEITHDLTLKGFTILLVMNPSAHPSDQANAILDLFDGEINVYETEDVFECKRFARVRKLMNQDYIKNPICLTKQT